MGTMTHDHLSDYEIAINFGDTLSLIYKEKMKELNEELSSLYAFIDSIQIPQVPDNFREFTKVCFNDKILCPIGHRNFKAIEHINKIRGMYKKMKKEPESNRPDYIKARSVPIETLYDFRRKGKNVSCPFHGEDRSPSMSLKYNRFYCFTCHVKGSSIDFIMRLNPEMKLKEAVDYLNKL